jgi:SAM-dependent methyltransferase
MIDPVQEQKWRERRLRETTMPFGEFTLQRTLWWNLIELDNVLMRLRVPSGCRVLDVGCSDGRLIDRLRERGCKEFFYVGVDFAFDHLRKVINKMAMAVCADVAAPLFRKNAFDVAVSLQVVHHLASRQERLRVLRGMFDALVPGGQVAVSVLNRPSWASLVANGIEGPLLSSPELFVHLYLPETLREDLVETGFIVDEVVAVNNLPVRYLKRIGFLGMVLDILITKYFKGLSAEKGRYLLAVGRKA